MNTSLNSFHPNVAFLHEHRVLPCVCSSNCPENVSFWKTIWLYWVYFLTEWLSAVPKSNGHNLRGPQLLSPLLLRTDSSHLAFELDDMWRPYLSLYQSEETQNETHSESHHNVRLLCLFDKVAMGWKKDSAILDGLALYGCSLCRLEQTSQVIAWHEHRRLHELYVGPRFSAWLFALSNGGLTHADSHVEAFLGSRRDSTHPSPLLRH